MPDACYSLQSFLLLFINFFTALHHFFFFFYFTLKFFSTSLHHIIYSLQSFLLLFSNFFTSLQILLTFAQSFFTSLLHFQAFFTFFYILLSKNQLPGPTLAWNGLCFQDLIEDHLLKWAWLLCLDFLTSSSLRSSSSLKVAQSHVERKNYANLHFYKIFFGHLGCLINTENIRSSHRRSSIKKCS